MVLFALEPKNTKIHSHSSEHSTLSNTHTACQMHIHFKAQDSGGNEHWRQGSGQNVSGYKQKEPAETADSPWPQKEMEIISPPPAPVKSEPHTPRLLSQLSSILGWPSFSASHPGDTDRQVTLLGLPLHWLSLRGGGVGGTTEILLPRRNTRIMG